MKITTKLFLFLFFPFWISAQSELSTDILIQRMMLDYQEWLSKRVVNDLLVENDPSPIALDIQNPRFSWILNLEGRQRRQTAYQVLVASEKSILDSGAWHMWNSELVESDQLAQVIYKGLPLESNREYFWKVRIRDEAGKLHPYSKTEIFNTGLFNEEEWSALWIGKGEPDEMVSDVDAFVNQTASEEVKNIVHNTRSPQFRYEFQVDRQVRRARFLFAGLGLYELRLNGAKVGHNVHSPSKTDFRKRILYNTYDVASELNTGVNALGIMLGNCWFNGFKKITIKPYVPANTCATVHLPAVSGAVITESGKPVSGADGIRSVATVVNSAIFGLGSGSYLFSVYERPHLKGLI